jgi:pectinesterase
LRFGILVQNSAPAPAAGAVNQQAVALRITGDCGAFYNCGFYGAQDTLNDDMGRHYMQIVGSIDFIFGDAQSLYKVLKP